MSIVDSAEGWLEHFSSIFRPANRLAGLGEEFTAAGPMLRLLLEAPELASQISVYRLARSAVLADGTQLLREEYDLALGQLAKRLTAGGKGAMISKESRDAALIEMRAWHRYIGDAKRLAEIVQEAKGVLPPPVLEEIDSRILKLATESYTSYEGPFAAEVHARWNHFLKVVSPTNEAAWKEIIDACKIAGREGVSSKLYDIEQAAANPHWIENYFNLAQGKVFEAYVKNSPQFLKIVDEELRLTWLTAAKLGSEWCAIRLTGEMQLATVTSERLVEAASDLKGVEGLAWKSFVDHSVVAAKLPPGPKAGLGELDLGAVFQDKAEAGATELLEQQIKDMSRAFRGAGNRTVLARFKLPGESGWRYARLRPPGGSGPLRAYSIATSNTFVPPGNALLEELGATVKTRPMPVSRDEIRDFAEAFIAAAMVALSGR